MPTLAIVEGVKIQIYALGHAPPHFHVVVAEHRAQINIESLVVMKGEIPRAKLAAVLSWAEPRRVALLDAWNTIAEGERPEQIR
jgi:hypothetical protein